MQCRKYENYTKTLVFVWFSMNFQVQTISKSMKIESGANRNTKKLIGMRKIGKIGQIYGKFVPTNGHKVEIMLIDLATRGRPQATGKGFNPFPGTGLGG